MATAPLMPKATAVWLLDNTTLTFDQVAAFCVLHPLEVKAIADGDAAQGIKGMDPILSGQLTRAEIEKGQGDQTYRMKILEPKVRVPEVKRRGPRYTPVSKRQDRPNAILWLVRNHAELKDSAIMRLVGTTKPTIQAIRDRTHWNSATLAPTDPVTLGLCSQLELDMEVRKAAKAAPPPAEPQGARLLSAEETTALRARQEESEAAARHALHRRRVRGAKQRRRDRRRLRVRPTEIDQERRRRLIVPRHGRRKGPRPCRALNFSPTRSSLSLPSRRLQPRRCAASPVSAPA